MTPEQRMVRHFHEVFLGDCQTSPTVPDQANLETRSRLLAEETDEFIKAAQRRDLVAMVDALADVMYVILGTANVLGIDLEPVFAEVHRSNMTKSQPEGTDRKPTKGLHWSPPDILDQLRRQGWKTRDEAS